jgi:uncharacterized Tic20 family protein
MNTTSLTTDRPTDSERLEVLIAHAGPVLAWFLAPLLVYLLRRGSSRYVAFHALQSLLWSITGTLMALATCGLAIPVFLVWHIIAAVKVSGGQDYEYPFVGDLARGLL